MACIIINRANRVVFKCLNRENTKGNIKISEKEKTVAKRLLKIENSEKPIRKATPIVKSRKKMANNLFSYKFLFIKNKMNRNVKKAFILGNLKIPISPEYSAELEYVSTLLETFTKKSVNANLAIRINTIKISIESHLKFINDILILNKRLNNIPIHTIGKAT